MEMYPSLTHMPCQDYKHLDEGWSPLIQHSQSDPIT